MTQFCRDLRDPYSLFFTKISKTYPFQIDGTYVYDDRLLIITNGTYVLYSPVNPPYTCEEHGTIVDNQDGTFTITPLRIIGCGSGVSGYANTINDLPTCDSSISTQVYQVGECPNAEWYQCTCSGGVCSWVKIDNPVAVEIDSILDLPDEPCSGNRVYYGSFGSSGENIYYGCVNGEWRDIVNPGDVFGLPDDATPILCVPVDLTFSITEGYSTPKNKITTFNFETTYNTSLSRDVIGVIGESTITLEVPYGTDVTSLIPTILMTGSKVIPKSLIANDFTNDVFYDCYSQNGSKTNYVIKVSEEEAGDCEIFEFWFSETLNTAINSDFYGVINGTDITVNVPYGTTISSLIASFKTNANTISIGATTQSSGVTSNDFSTTLTYVLEDHNGLNVNYTVNVFVADVGTNKEITRFYFSNEDNPMFPVTYEGTIDEDTHLIDVEIENRTNFRALYPTIHITGVSVSPKSKSKVNFSTDDSYTFTVTDYNGATQDYDVNLTVLDDPEQRIGIDFHGDTSDEDLLQPSGWVKNVDFSFSFPSEVTNILGNVTSFLGSVNGFLSKGKAALNIAKILVAGVGNPLLSVFDFFLNEIITFIRNIKNSGFYFCQIIPDTKLYQELFVDLASLNPHYVDGKLEKLLSEMTDEEREAYDKLVLNTRDIRYFNFKFTQKIDITPDGLTTEKSPVSTFEDPNKLQLLLTEYDVLNTLKNTESKLKVIEAKYMKNQLMSGFWLLSGDGALRMFAESFQNIHDVDQPLYNPPIPIKNYNYFEGGKLDYKQAPTLLDKENLEAGGMILWLGLGGGVDLVNAVKKFIVILRKILYFFGDSKLKGLLEELQDLQNRFWSAWTPNTKYYVGDIVTKVESETDSTDTSKKTLDKYKYVCTRVGDSGYGTSGSTEPTWPETYKGQVSDNDIIWTESSITDFVVRDDQGKFWQKRKIFRDWFKPGYDILTDIESLLVGFRDKIPTGYESINTVIEYVEDRIDEISNIVSLIESFISIVDNFDNLTDFNMSGYMVPVQSGGIAKLIDGALDETDPNRPSATDYTLALFSFIGTGAAIPGYLLLTELLFGAGGAPSEFKNSVNQAKFPWGLDTLTDSVFADEETLKKKFFDEDKVRKEIEAETNIITDKTF